MGADDKAKPRGGPTRLQLYMMLAGVALGTYMVTSKVCYDKCRSTMEVHSALGSMSRFNSDQLITRIAVLTETSEGTARKLDAAQADLKSTHTQLLDVKDALQDAQAAKRRLQEQLDTLTTRVAVAETRASSCQSKLQTAEDAARASIDSVKVALRQGDRSREVQAVAPVQCPPPAPAASVSAGGSSASFAWGKNFATMPRCTGPPPLDGPPPDQTHVQCFQSSDWAEICVYDLLCTDGDRPVIISDTQKPGKSAWGHWGIGDVAEGYHTFDVYPRPPPKSRDIPLNSRARPYYLPSSALANAEWTDRSMWIIEPEYRTWELQHLFFFAHGAFPMWEAQHSNDTWGGAIPPLQDVFFMFNAAKYHFNDWNYKVLDLIMPPTASVKYMNELTDAGVSKTKLRCSRRGILSGNKPNLFSGMKTAHAFRAAAYAKYGITMPSQPPKKLVIFNRANAGRRFENMAEMEELFKKYNIPYEVVSKHGSFEKQVRTMSSAGVLMLAHGAAATNTMFQPHRSVVVEVFPYHRKRYGFKTVADVIGNFYMPIYSTQLPRQGKSIMNETAWKTQCEHLPGIKTNAVGTCDQAQKVVTIFVDIPTLERTIVDAFDVIGYRVDLDAKKGSSGRTNPKKDDDW